LEALLGSTRPPCEIVVVDDASQDSSVEIAVAMGVRVIRSCPQKGVSSARNLGASQTCSPILVFVDCDIVIHSNGLERIANFLSENSEYSAVFGSYDSEPAVRTSVSQYRNLLHHFTHQEAQPNAETFWGGIGAVRRQPFNSIGGFRSEKDGLEDVDFGLRLTDAGHRIALDRQLLGTHHKHWSLFEMIRTDIFKRAKIWASVVLERRQFTNSLNTSTINKIGVLSAGLFLGSTALSLVLAEFIYIALASLLVNIISNFRVYKNFALVRGPLFVLLVIPLHLVHQLCAGLGFALASIERFFNIFVSRVGGNRFLQNGRQ
jgi:glycosyltransferase involved in cell wall biosynthesis